jgi:hypothetical protein
MTRKGVLEKMAQLEGWPKEVFLKKAPFRDGPKR